MDAPSDVGALGAGSDDHAATIAPAGGGPRLPPGLRASWAALVAGAAAGELAFGLLSVALDPRPGVVAWRSAALGGLLGAAGGLLLAPLAWLAVGARGEALRRWAYRHGRGLAVTMFLLPVLLAVAAEASLVVLMAVLPRLQVPEVAVIMALATTATIAGATALVGGTLGAACAARLRPRTSAGQVFVGPLVAAALALPMVAALGQEMSGLLASGRSGRTPLDVLRVASPFVDVVGLLALAWMAIVLPPFAALAFRRPLVGLPLLATTAGLLGALAGRADGLQGALGPGPRLAALHVLQRSADRDGDGHATRFGQRDCDDHDPSVFPGAREVPGNGRDDDCSYGDLSPGALAALDAPDPLTPAVRARLDATVPAALNLVVLTVDSLRADLHYAGNPLRVSPNLDLLAARSVVFTRAYATASYTVRSFGALMTGRYADELVRSRETHHRYGSANVLLAERLRAAGFRDRNSQFMANTAFLRSRSGLTDGFGVLHPDLIPPESAPLPFSDDRVADRACEVVLEPRAVDERFFVWAHFVDPHNEYVPHPEMGDFGRGALGRYWQEVAWTDRQIGRVIAAIDALPEAQRRRTALIVTADHGEAFHEHGVGSHGSDLWDEHMHVPLLISIPGVAPRTIDTPRSLVDLAPTMLDLLRVPRPDRAAPDAMSGVTLVPDLLGDAPPARPVYADLPARGDGWVAVSVLIDGRMKVRVHGDDPPTLFDLVADPGERLDLARRRPAELTRMLGLLAALRARMRYVPPSATIDSE